MAKKSLLELARSECIRKIKDYDYTSEDEELVLAWCNNEIQLNQVKRVKGISNTTQTYIYIAQVCRFILGNHKP